MTAAAEAETHSSPASTGAEDVVSDSGGGSSRAPGRPEQEVVFVALDEYFSVIEEYRNGGFEMCADLCAVDYLTHPTHSLPDGVVPQRFEVVVNLLSLSAARRVRVRVQVPESDPVAPSIFDVYPGTEAMEREVFDLFGIVFVGHPDLTRILMPEDWEGHPLRKDYGVGRVPVQFKGAPGPR